MRSDLLAVRTVPACPPWCTKDPEWHNDDTAVHSGPTVVIASDCRTCSRHDDPQDGTGICDVWLSLERVDEPDRPETPGVVYVSLLAGHGLVSEAHLSVDRLEELAREALALVELARAEAAAVSS